MRCLLEQSVETLAAHSGLKLVGLSLSKTSLRDLVALDIDVSPFDNSNTQKEGVSWTHKKVDGYAPIFAYLREKGWRNTLIYYGLVPPPAVLSEKTNRLLQDAAGFFLC